MSYTRRFIRFCIKIAILAIRFVGWLQSGNIKKNKQKGEFLKARILTNHYARKYVPTIKHLEQKEITVEAPETLWQFWDNPVGKQTPEIVKSSLETSEKFKGNLQRKVLDNSTFEDYTDLPGHVLDKFKKGIIHYTQFSELLRINLLKNHGGIWLDATGYMTDFFPKYIIDEDFFAFLTGDLTDFPYSFVQSCFIRAKKGSFLCEAWHDMSMEYWKKETKILDYFQFHLMFKALIEKDPRAKELFAKMPHKSEDETHQLTGYRLLTEFDANEWERIKKRWFFQKTTFKIDGNFTDYPNTYFSKLSEGCL